MSVAGSLLADVEAALAIVGSKRDRDPAPTTFPLPPPPKRAGLQVVAASAGTSVNGSPFNTALPPLAGPLTPPLPNNESGPHLLSQLPSSIQIPPCLTNDPHCYTMQIHNIFKNLPLNDVNGAFTEFHNAVLAQSSGGKVIKNKVSLCRRKQGD